MVRPQDLEHVRTIMSEFADRTALSGAGGTPKRYLWTDAFAVCNYLSLFEETRDEAYLGLATRLIGQVHETLGRHRPDDSRAGWISGLGDEEGRRHPTAGGLRIGKPLNERPEGRPFKQAEEWDRDGQYFHYLTKWMLALERTAVVTSDETLCRFALELAEAAHAAFSYKAADGSQRMIWKASIDLSRALVPSAGHHDPLDALVSYSVLEFCRKAHFADAGLPELGSQIGEAAGMCAGRDWVTDDCLGIGGLLVDAFRIGQLREHGVTVAGTSLDSLLTAVRTGLTQFARNSPLQAPAEHRLAFRELGLAIGLHALDALHRRYADRQLGMTDAEAGELERLSEICALAEQIEAFWLDPVNRSASTWREHIDINSVMLATSLLPRQFVLV
jgi:hypothetical protein